MDSAAENATVQLDPAIVGSFGSAPLTGVRTQMLLQEQSAWVALETKGKMAERAELMFLTLDNGPHSSGMSRCRVDATNATLELVGQVAHAVVGTQVGNLGLVP